MADAPRASGFSLRRWSQRKLAAARGEDLARSDTAAVVERDGAAGRPDAQAPPPAPGSVTGTSTAAATADVAQATGSAGTEAAAPATPLPPVESLTIDSDFSPFMQPGVDENVKRMALRKLLRDPRFNVMDGLDVYIDDYSKPSPLDPALARTLAQARYIFDPPKTRVTAEGVVEDVPDEPVEAVADAAVAQTPPALVDRAATGAEAAPPLADADVTASREPAAATTDAREGVAPKPADPPSAA